MEEERTIIDKRLQCHEINEEKNKKSNKEKRESD